MGARLRPARPARLAQRSTSAISHAPAAARPARGAEGAIIPARHCDRSGYCPLKRNAPLKIGDLPRTSRTNGLTPQTGSTVDGLQAGQQVLAVLRNGGGYAEEIVLDAAAVVPIPEAMDFVTAAAFPVACGTSHFALTHRSHLQLGETLLVLGAAGGVGLTAVEIGRAMGARVIAAAGGPQKLAVARARGADELIDDRKESIRDRCAR